MTRRFGAKTSPTLADKQIVASTVNVARSRSSVLISADALESLSPIAERISQPSRAPFASQNRSATDYDGVRVATARRGRLALVRSRMRNEFGVGAGNYGGSQSSFDGASEADSTSVASWGRRLLKETSADASPSAVVPLDTLSTRASRWVEATATTSADNDEQHRVIAAAGPSTSGSIATSPLRAQPPPLPPRRSEHGSSRSSAAAADTNTTTSNGLGARAPPLPSASTTPDRPSPFVTSTAPIKKT